MIIIIIIIINNNLNAFLIGRLYAPLSHTFMYFVSLRAGRVQAPLHAAGDAQAEEHEARQPAPHAQTVGDDGGGDDRRARLTAGVAQRQRQTRRHQHRQLQGRDESIRSRRRPPRTE